MNQQMPDDVRRELIEAYDEAAEVGLHPKWHDDGDGFELDCPICKDRGKENHRVDLEAAINIEAYAAQFLPFPPDVAKGPAG